MRTPPSTGYRTWFENRVGQRLLHISLGVGTIAAWQAKSSVPAPWAFGFPARVAAIWLAALPGVREHVGEDPSCRHPAATPELEDLVEALVKVNRAQGAGDAALARLHAHDAACLVPAALRGLNAPRLVSTRADALAAALSLDVIPNGYVDDMQAALGLREATDADVADAALRLGRGTLELLRAFGADIDPQPGIREALSDGTLERLLDAPSPRP